MVDLEAGLEELSRGTPKHVDTLLVVVEPYFRSLETARCVCELALELGVPRVHLVANKVRDPDDAVAIRDFGGTHGLSVIAELPYDPSLIEAERQGAAPIDHDPASPAVSEIRRLAGRLRVA